MDTLIGKVLDFGVNKFKSITDFDENLETLERKVKLLSDKAVDVKTDVENQERSGKKKRKREVGSWFGEVKKVKKGLRALKEEGARGKKNVGSLEKMNGRVGKLLEQSKHFGAPGTLVHDIYDREECPLPVPQVHEEISKQNIKDICSCLQDNNVSCIGIYGMGGVGKTTWAKHIHNWLNKDTHYQVHWVTVSQGFSIKRLQDDLANIVNLDLSNVADEQIRAGKLCWAFKKSKNIVIILDDVWDRLCLEKLGNPLRMEGCRLILTTRSREVCQKMGCQKLFKVEELNTDDAWELFKKSLGDETLLSPDIERVAKSMARKCKGLPLGLITLAGSMRGVTDIREWRNALKEFPDDMESDVFKVLQYSYDRLGDTNMQECFLYCALYPEDYQIDRKELIGRFIMEGLVKGDTRQEEFDQGHTILNKLVKVCLLEAATIWIGEQIKMHDLLREMALRITNVKSKYMVGAGIRSQVPEEQDWAFDLDKVSFRRSILSIPEDMAPNCPTLSTLLFYSCSLRRIPESFFQHMNNLQVLDLSHNSELMDLPSCISNLGILRAISLRECTKLRSVPPLGKLKSLRMLDLHHTGIKEVPQGMGSLVKLKFLDMGQIHLEKEGPKEIFPLTKKGFPDVLNMEGRLKYLKKELPKDILPKLSHLQYLRIPKWINVQAEDLASLELLEDFEGRFCDLHNFNKFMTSCRNYEKVWRYDICVGANLSSFDPMPELSSFDHIDDENHGIKERRVVVKDCTIEAGGGEAPTSIILPHCIQVLDIENCHGLSSCLVDNFLSQTTLTGLICDIHNCDDIEWIINVPSGRNTTTDPHCICFRGLSVRSLPNLVGLFKGKIASHTFSVLRELRINECHKMKKLFPRAILPDLKNLQQLDVGYCKEMEEIIAEEATEQDGSSQLGTSSDILILPKLRRLYLSLLPKLKRICEGKLICDSLESMSLYECPKLKRLPFYAHSVISACDEIEEIIAEEATDQDGSSQFGTSSDILILPKLKTLWLDKLPKLKSIGEGKLICDSLVSIGFLGCPKLKRLPFYTPTTNAHPFPALREIEAEEKWWETLEQSHLKTLFQPYVEENWRKRLEREQSRLALRTLR